MRCVSLLVVVLVFAAFSAEAHAQRNLKKDAEFVTTSPAAGDPVPEVTVFTPDGREFNTSELRGHYTVLTFGCLT